jgi:hypothetical protein
MNHDSSSVGGSPLANDAEQSDLNMLQHFPEATCTPGDGGGLESLKPSTHKAWLAENTLPDGVSYYSLLSFPEPDRISSILKGSYKKLAKVDARKDSQVIFYDQFIPGSTLVAYINADHWALAVPIARSHSSIGSLFVDKNDYPREAFFESLLRSLVKPAAQYRTLTTAHGNVSARKSVCHRSEYMTSRSMIRVLKLPATCPALARLPILASTSDQVWV